MIKKTRYTYLHGLLGTNIDWNTELEKSLGNKGDIFAPQIDYFQDPDYVRAHIKSNVSEFLAKGSSRNVLIANSVGCHFGMDILYEFDIAFFVSPTYDFDRGTVSRTRSGIRSEVKKLFFDQTILEKHSDVLERETIYIADRLKKLSSINSLKNLKSELTKSDYVSKYKENSEKIHVILGNNDVLIPTDRYLSRQKELGISIDVIENCSHVAPVEKPEELRKIIVKYGA